jgi:hypothetical protein
VYFVLQGTLKWGRIQRDKWDQGSEIKTPKKPLEKTSKKQ